MSNLNYKSLNPLEPVSMRVEGFQQIMIQSDHLQSMKIKMRERKIARRYYERRSLRYASVLTDA